MESTLQINWPNPESSKAKLCASAARDVQKRATKADENETKHEGRDNDYRYVGVNSNRCRHDNKELDQRELLRTPPGDSAPTRKLGYNECRL